MPLSSDQMLAQLRQERKNNPHAEITIPLPFRMSDPQRVKEKVLAQFFKATIHDNYRERTSELKIEIDNRELLEILTAAFREAGDERWIALQELAETVSAAISEADAKSEAELALEASNERRLKMFWEACKRTSEAELRSNRALDALRDAKSKEKEERDAAYGRIHDKLTEIFERTERHQLQSVGGQANE